MKLWMAIGLFSIYCVAYGSIRYWLEGDAWGFLHYNLWLAWIPVGLAVIIRWQFRRLWILIPTWIFWIAFLPNAPYIVTDFIHIRTKSTLPWFDVILIFHFALAGLLAGVLSLFWVQETITKRFRRVYAVGNSILAISASGAGMVIGRDLRINSKDIFVSTGKVTGEIVTAINGQTCLKAIVYASMFGIFYIGFLAVASSRR